MLALCRAGQLWKQLANINSLQLIQGVSCRFLGNRVDVLDEGQNRLKQIENFENYPSFRVTHSFKEIKEKWDYLQKGERDTKEELLVAGRIINKRKSGSKLVFYDIRSGEIMLQIMSSINQYSLSSQNDEERREEFRSVHRNLRVGDIIGVRGIPGRTDMGELSILPKQITLLSPCLWKLPREWYEIKDPEVKYRQRYLSLIVNKSIREVFYKRSVIIKSIRDFMEQAGFLDVETSILSSQAGGAVASPFYTHSNAQNQDLSLRISPELLLKELVVGGFDRVYEMGKVFRNEGLNNKHNYEFTSIEAYMTYHDYRDWMRISEALLSGICLKLHGKEECEFNGVTINYKPPYRCIDVEEELSKVVGNLPNWNDESNLPLLLEKCKEHHITVVKPVTLSRVYDTLISHFIEPQCIQPTFIIHHPMVMSPLSKEHGNSGKSERFELFVNGMEIINAYTEQNDPQKQEYSFQKQGTQREAGDKEIPPTDAGFIRALEYGMPPTTGWGMGVDRLVMLMTNQTSIRDVMLFPMLKQKE